MATFANSREEVQACGTFWSPPVKDADREHDKTKYPQQCKNRDRPTWGFGEFGKYMEEKTRKLREQFQSNSAESLLQSSEDDGVIMSKGLSQIFQGITIWVDGYTIPSHQELKRLMLAHGGIFENYMSSQVTHIICSHLPDGKYLDYRHKRSLPPILKPAWLTDSILAGQQLPVDRYKLLRLAYDHPGQTTLAVAFKALQLPLAQASPHFNTSKEQKQEQLKTYSDRGIESGSDDVELLGGSASIGMNRDFEPVAQASPDVCKIHSVTNLEACWNTAARINGGLSGKAKSLGGYEGKQEKISGLDLKNGTCSLLKAVGESERDFWAESSISFISDEHAAIDTDFLSICPVDTARAGVQHVADVDANSAEKKNVLNLKMEVEDEHQDLVLKTAVPVNSSTEVVDFDGSDSILNVEETQLVRETNEDDQLGNGRGELGKQESDEVFPSKALTLRSHSTRDDPKFIQNYYKYSRLHFIGTWRNRYHAATIPLEAYSVANKPNLKLSLPSEKHKLASNLGTFLGLKPKYSAERSIIHIDMDCFFVSVVIRNRPELTNQPVAVCHSDSSRGTAEISSANYIARNFGVSAGMFMQEAKRRCPNLMVVPYDFEAYEKVADQVYAILHRHSSIVQALSCDEAFLDVTGLGDAAAIASAIRREIAECTQCPASAGIAHNLLLARLATRKAKPNGQIQVLPEQAVDFVAGLSVADLHGVGYALRERLHAKGLKTCANLQKMSRDSLQREFGGKTGNMLWSYARGIDSRPVQPAQERKSIGAEINWGVRFSCEADLQKFLKDLVGEVCCRLSDARVQGRTISLKAKKRKAGAPEEPAKFMGCGACDNFSRSTSLQAPTNDPHLILRSSKKLYAAMGLNPTEVRGVGLQVSKLEPTVTTKATPLEKIRTGGSLLGAIPVCWSRRSGEPRDIFEEAVLGVENTVSKHEMRCRTADIEGGNPAFTSSEGACEALKGKVNWLENQQTGHAVEVVLAGNNLQDIMKEEEKVPATVTEDLECKLKEGQGENIRSMHQQTEQTTVQRVSEESEKAAKKNIELGLKPVDDSFNVSLLTFGEAGPSKEPLRLKAGFNRSLPPVYPLDPAVLAAHPEEELEAAHGLDKGHGHLSCKTGGLKQDEVDHFEGFCMIESNNRLDKKSSVMPEHFVDQCGYKGDKGKEGAIVRNGLLKVEDAHVFLRSSSENSMGATDAETEGNPRTEMECRPPTSSVGVEALPPASQVDRSVLDALPLALRCELERAYGQKASEGGLAVGALRRRAAACTATRGRKRARVSEHRGGDKKQLTLLPLVWAAPSVCFSHQDLPNCTRSNDVGSCSETRGRHLYGSAAEEETTTQAADAPMLKVQVVEKDVLPTDEVVFGQTGVEIDAKTWDLTFTQIDQAVFAELPRDIQEDVMRSMPIRRKGRQRAPECVATTALQVNVGTGTISDKGESVSVKKEEIMETTCDGSPKKWEKRNTNELHTCCLQNEIDPVGLSEVAEASAESKRILEGLWEGLPPIWIPLCKKMDICSIGPLHILAEAVTSCEMEVCLSQVLKLVSRNYGSHAASQETDDAVALCVAVIVQYVERIGAQNLEEVLAVAKILNRLAKQWPFWQLVKGYTEPALQVFVKKYYGGHLQLR